MSVVGALSLSLVLMSNAADVQPPEGPARASEGPSGSKDERVAQAFTNYEKQRFDAAALEFEGLWQEFREPRFLFNAAVSRVGARHHAHAVAYLSEYLGTAGLAADDRAEAEAQRKASLRETVGVRVTIEAPADLAAIEFAVQHVQKLASDIRPPLRFAAEQASGTQRARVVDLDPGEWKVRVELPGYEVAEEIVRVDSGAQPIVALSLVRVTRNDASNAGVPDRVRKKFVQGASVAGGLVLVGGAAALAVGQVKFGQSFGTPETDCAPDQLDCRTALASGGTLRGIGAGLLGAGVGGAVAGLTGVIGAGKRRRTAWIAEAALGGAAAVGGAVWIGLSGKRFTAANSRGDVGWGDADNQAAVSGFAAQHTAATAVVGFGAGMLVGGVGGVLLERAYARGPRSLARRGLKVGGGATPTWSGVVVSGRF